jgi:hypothetical protein
VGEPVATPLLEAFDRQIAWCRLPAPFSARVLRRTRRWLVSDAAAAAALAEVAQDPLAAAVPLRWLGGLHHLALRGLAPWAPLWSDASQDGPFENRPLDHRLDDAIRQAWTAQRAALQAALSLPPQTNEVQRSVAMLPGLLHVAAQSRRPLELLEIGASAGLNLWCDRYRYEHGPWQWGDAASGLTLRCDWQGPSPVAASATSTASAPLHVARRAACDAQPIDLRRPDESLRLASFIWPDQAERLARLHRARHLVAGWMAESGLAVEASSAVDFLRRELPGRRAGHALVLMHSVVWQYIDAPEQQGITALVEAAGALASVDAPLAWLRLEPSAQDGSVALRCRYWPAGQDVLLAAAHPHVAHLTWHEPAPHGYTAATPG